MYQIKSHNNNKRNMSEEIDDNEFFQQDFTTASEWEIFSARLEEIFHEWKLPYIDATGDSLGENQLAFCGWSIQNETVFFADVELNITRYCAKIPTTTNDCDGNNVDDKETASGDADVSGKITSTISKQSNENRKCQAFIDIMALANNYCVLDEKSDETIHPLARWYGLRDFVVVSPAQKSITNESQIRILMSSIHIAVAESNCEVPVFVQALDKKQHVYSGSYECWLMKATGNRIVNILCMFYDVNLFLFYFLQVCVKQNRHGCHLILFIWPLRLLPANICRVFWICSKAKWPYNI